MRISVEPDDPGFRPDLIDSEVVVTLDGEPIAMPITADEQEGSVEFFPAGPDGDPQLTADGSDAVRERREGKVEIHLPPERLFAT